MPSAVPPGGTAFSFARPPRSAPEAATKFPDGAALLPQSTDLVGLWVPAVPQNAAEFMLPAHMGNQGSNSRRTKTMLKLVKTFRKHESGAVTVDWVVLTAAVVGLCGLAFGALQEATGGLGSSVGETLTETKVE